MTNCKEQIKCQHPLSGSHNLPDLGYSARTLARLTFVKIFAEPMKQFKGHYCMIK